MRTDVKRDNKSTRLPNASHLGYDLWTAKRGNWIVTSDGHCGRVLGGVTALSGEDKGTRYIEAAVLSSDHTFNMLRWYLPDQIAQCIKEPPLQAFEQICGNVSALEQHVRKEA